MTNDETDSTMAPPWWKISSFSGRRHGDMDDGEDDDTDDDTDDGTDDDTDDDHDDNDTDDDDHKNDRYTAARAAPGASIINPRYFLAFIMLAPGAARAAV